MAQVRPITGLVNLAAWITGILVSLAVGFGMISKTLTIPWAGNLFGIVPIAGWVVVILTLVSIILAIADRF
jgi:hypothetical protein